MYFSFFFFFILVFHLSNTQINTKIEDDIENILISTPKKEKGRNNNFYQCSVQMEEDVYLSLKQNKNIQINKCEELEKDNKIRNLKEEVKNSGNYKSMAYCFLALTLVLAIGMFVLSFILFKLRKRLVDQEKIIEENNNKYLVTCEEMKLSPIRAEEFTEWKAEEFSIYESPKNETPSKHTITNSDIKTNLIHEFSSENKEDDEESDFNSPDKIIPNAIFQSNILNSSMDNNKGSPNGNPTESPDYGMSRSQSSKSGSNNSNNSKSSSLDCNRGDFDKPKKPTGPYRQFRKPNAHKEICQLCGTEASRLDLTKLNCKCKLTCCANCYKYLANQGTCPKCNQILQ